MTNTISTATLAAGAKAGVVVDEYRGYQIVDRETFVAICRDAAVIQCAHTPAEARAAIDNLIAAESRGSGTLITTYRGYELREAARRDGISLGVDVFHAGAFAFAERNAALAKSQIDYVLTARRETPAQAAPVAPQPEMSAAERKARAAKLLGRRENNPNDLI